MLNFIQHAIVHNDGTLPELPLCLYAYILAGNGIFVKAKREGLDVLIPVCQTRIAGLPPLTPYVKLPCRVPENLLLTALELSRQVVPNEILFWFNRDEDWRMDIPLQVARACSVVPMDHMDVRGTRALIDLHSHGVLLPFFSPTDDRDEQGFRIYAVIGEVDTTPGIRVRVGVYGHYFDVPASEVFEVPTELLDIFKAEEVQHEVTTEQR
jgi:PRTRC genetic system protein A